MFVNSKFKENIKYTNFVYFARYDLSDLDICAKNGYNNINAQCTMHNAQLRHLLRQSVRLQQRYAMHLNDRELCIEIIVH